MRDSEDDWFYWAFCVKSAGGKTVTFNFESSCVGYYEPAVIHDLKTWRWPGKQSEYNKFTYNFKNDEQYVYFAHNMIYSSGRFKRFAETAGLAPKTFCVSEKGRNIPYLEAGEGEKDILITSRQCLGVLRKPCK